MNAANDLASPPHFHAEIEMDAEWRPIEGYNKVLCSSVLLRGAEQAVFGHWARGYVPEGETSELAWRSLEDSTLDSPLWFEPEQFAALSDADEQFFLHR